MAKPTSSERIHYTMPSHFKPLVLKLILSAKQRTEKIALKKRLLILYISANIVFTKQEKKKGAT